VIDRRYDDGEREIVTMSWGFMLLQKGRAPRIDESRGPFSVVCVAHLRKTRVLASHGRRTEHRVWRPRAEAGRAIVSATSVRQALLAHVLAQRIGHGPFPVVRLK
jgi:hypothetical protein